MLGIIISIQTFFISNMVILECFNVRVSARARIFHLRPLTEHLLVSFSFGLLCLIFLLISEQKRVLIHYVPLTNLESICTGKVTQGFCDLHCFQSITILSLKKLLATERAENHDALFSIILGSIMQASVTLLIALKQITIVLQQSLQTILLVVPNCAKKWRVSIFIITFK